MAPAFPAEGLLESSASRSCTERAINITTLLLQQSKSVPSNWYPQKTSSKICLWDRTDGSPCQKYGPNQQLPHLFPRGFSPSSHSPCHRPLERPALERILSDELTAVAWKLKVRSDTYDASPYQFGWTLAAELTCWSQFSGNSEKHGCLGIMHDLHAQTIQGLAHLTRVILATLSHNNNWQNLLPSIGLRLWEWARINDLTYGQ